MANASLEELKGQIAAGEYAIDSHMVADRILSTFAVIRRVGRSLMSEDVEGAEDPEGAAGQAGLGPQPQPRTRRGSRPTPSHPLQPRHEPE
jgi:hypothetical protein